MTLRPYQQKAIDDLYAWLRDNTGDPCVVMPTGSGKSHAIAHFVDFAIEQYPDTRIVILSHVKELIEQDYEKLIRLWPNAPAAIYCEGLKRKEIDRITFASIQSVRKKADLLGIVNICIVDEAHLISHKDQGGYRMLINALREKHPSMRVIGFTATPWRLGHGKITDGEALFDDLIEPTSIYELIQQGYLSPLISRATDTRYNTAGLHKRGGEYIEKELQKRVDTDDQNTLIAKEIVDLAGDRIAWLLFCTGINHAYHMRDALRSLGITVETVTSKTPRKERDDILRRYKAGEIRALTNASVLTTGFDYPDIDLIALLRPTMSPGLYMQMIGRGFRPKSHTDHCFVLDFAGVIAQHGPVTGVQPPANAGEGNGIAPGKECPQCHWIVPLSLRVCNNPECGYGFPEPQKKEAYLRNDDIMGDKPSEMEVSRWQWDRRKSKYGNPMIVVSYYETMFAKPISEYLLIWSDGYVGMKHRDNLKAICKPYGIDYTSFNNVDDFLVEIGSYDPPASIVWVWNGKYKRVIDRVWSNADGAMQDVRA